ncbi:uncharacterized protein C8Q71DRAFT_778145 [Rhodofomes roseus]|uniref:Uncharacterized protein n=1 Tax=Rhodofomes roseus TaxID=34475 RepID=A0ABQ8K642_9APHY|nr:uncharacterized protein C8Q71DRAFT_778145 [Rhodofomes roseus]KAH9832254.1 hypothetical protein C8Q71DRAFT_778145 [Rhodofomes roseus]
MCKPQHLLHILHSYDIQGSWLLPELPPRLLGVFLAVLRRGVRITLRVSRKWIMRLVRRRVTRRGLAGLELHVIEVRALLEVEGPRARLPDPRALRLAFRLGSVRDRVRVRVLRLLGVDGLGVVDAALLGVRRHVSRFPPAQGIAGLQLFELLKRAGRRLQEPRPLGLLRQRVGAFPVVLLDRSRDLLQVTRLGTVHQVVFVEPRWVRGHRCTHLVPHRGDFPSLEHVDQGTRHDLRVVLELTLLEVHTSGVDGQGKHRRGDSRERCQNERQSCSNAHRGLFVGYERCRRRMRWKVGR